MKALVVLIILISQSVAWARGEVASMQRGPFAITPFIGERWDRLLNTDGTMASFAGLEYGANLGINIFNIGNDGGGVDIFAQYVYSDTSSRQNSTDSLSRQETMYGLNLFYTDWGFVSLGYGNATNDFKSTSYDSKSTHNFLAVGLGFDFYQMGDFQFSLQGWYKNGYISKDTNADLLQNSGYESAEVILGLKWAPALLQVSGKK